MIRALLIAALVAAPQGARADDGTDADGDGAVIERATLEVGPALRPIGAVAIDNPYGDVRIEGYDGASVVIDSVKHAPDPTALARLRVAAVRGPDGAVRLTTELTARKDRPAVALASVRVDLVVRVPRAARIAGRVGAGRLSVANVDAGADLDSSTGPIVVRNVAGVVFARSLAGSQRFEEVFGTLDSHAVDGDLAFDGVRGARLSAQAYDGDIAGRRVASREVRVSTIAGAIDVEAEAQVGGALTLTSLRGSVDLRLRRGGGLTVRARAGGRVTMTGATSTAGPDGWVEAQAGGRRGRAGVRVESRFGDVTFSLVQ